MLTAARTTHVTAITVGLAAVLSVAHAEARPISKADRKVVKKGLVHMDAMSGILNKWMGAPKHALDELERYVNKHRKRIIALKRKADAIKLELDADQKTEWKRLTSGAPETVRMFQTVMMFWRTHRKDPDTLARMKRLLSSVQPPKKAPKKDAPGKAGSKHKKK